MGWLKQIQIKTVQRLFVEENYLTQVPDAALAKFQPQRRRDTGKSGQNESNQIQFRVK